MSIDDNRTEVEMFSYDQIYIPRLHEVGSSNVREIDGLQLEEDQRALGSVFALQIVAQINPVVFLGY